MGSERIGVYKDLHLRKNGRSIEDHGVVASQANTEEDKGEGGEGNGELPRGESLSQRLLRVGLDLLERAA